MYFHRPQTQGDKARIYGATYRGGERYCLEFFYHMYGSAIGTLNVYAERRTVQSNVVWSKSGNQGDVWRYATVTVTSKDDFNIVIEGVVGSSFTGDIAIDDVKVVANDCPAPGFCDFEQGLCSWANAQNVGEYGGVTAGVFSANKYMNFY